MAKREMLNNDVVTLRVGEPVTEVIDNTLDTIEQTLDILENQVDRVVTVTKNNPFLLAGVAIAGIGIGVFVGFKIAQKKLVAEYDARLDEEIEKSKNHYMRRAKEGEFESPEAAVRALVPEEVVEAVQNYRSGEKTPYNRPDDIVEEKVIATETVERKVEVKTRNIFDEVTNPPNWDQDQEESKRLSRPDEPYVISLDEFNEGVDGTHYEQATLTYYAEDDVLVDQNERPVDNTDYTVGDDNLRRFGHGSHDRNVVYIRNERLEMDFEVIQDKGSYQHAVLGVNPERELKHSRDRRDRRRFRED